MNQLVRQPVTVTLTKRLVAELEGNATSAVNRKDLETLRVLHEMQIPLERALLQAARCGYHDITTALRDMGVQITPEMVDLAVSKSPESYWNLCGGADRPAYVDVAFQVAVREGKYGFAESLLDRWKCEVNDTVMTSLFQPKKPIPSAFINRLFAALPEAPFSVETLWRAAQVGTPPIVDRALRLTPSAAAGTLLAVAMKANNGPVSQELAARNGAVTASIVHTYVRAPYRGAHRDNDKNEVDANFLRMFAHHHISLTLKDLEPVLREFMTRKASRYCFNGWSYDKTQERDCISWMVRVLESAELTGLMDCIDRTARELYMLRLPDSQRPLLSAEVREMVEQAETYDFNGDGFHP